MNKNEKTTSIRFSPDIDSKIAWLKDEESKVSKQMGVKPKNRTQIIEDAIKFYYYKRINDTQDADVVERIGGLVSDQVDAAMSYIRESIDEILFLSIKNDLGNRVLYRSPSVLPAPKDKEQAMRVIMNETSMWDLALEEYLMDRWAREKVLIHVRQEED